MRARSPEDEKSGLEASLDAKYKEVDEILLKLFKVTNKVKHEARCLGAPEYSPWTDELSEYVTNRTRVQNFFMATVAVQ